MYHLARAPERRCRRNRYRNRSLRASVVSPHAYRIAIFGAGGVGKSTITIQFINDHFVEDYDPTIEDEYGKQVTVDDSVPAGQAEFSVMRDSWIKYFIFVYSITSRSSFDQFFSVLLGNKCDLESERMVTKLCADS